MFRPGIPLTICTVIALVLLALLGTWQAGKVGPKTALLAKIQTNMTTSPEQLPVNIREPKKLAYRHMLFTGERIAEPIRVFGTNQRGESGYNLYAPVRRDTGKIVIVNFGWIPLSMKATPSLPMDRLLYAGVVLENGASGSMTPANNPAENIWYTSEVNEIAAYFGFAEGDYYEIRFFRDHVDSDGGYPLGGQVRVDIPNNHFQYALTWYGLALALIGVYVVFGLKRAKEKP
ncbi:SURF1 family protein [Kordiimonas pumila]|uniref:SURF1-like protein n=1 Tax=Kordiimonas pumila TaxID=2161677 RepID=A0ABV7D8C3_9PROT|nr:SURF1 family protein [Kordiimonas pumila]